MWQLQHNLFVSGLPDSEEVAALPLTQALIATANNNNNNNNDDVDVDVESTVYWPWHETNRMKIQDSIPFINPDIFYKSVVVVVVVAVVITVVVVLLNYIFYFIIYY